MSATPFETQSKAFSINLEQLSERPLETSMQIDQAYPRVRKHEDGFAWEQVDTTLIQFMAHSPDTGLIIDPTLIEHALEIGDTPYWANCGLQNLMIHPRIANNFLSIGHKHGGLGAPAVTTTFLFDTKSGEITYLLPYKSRVMPDSHDHSSFESAARNNPSGREKQLIVLARLMEKAVETHVDTITGAHSTAKTTVARCNRVANVVLSRLANEADEPWIYRVDPDDTGMRLSLVPLYHAGVRLGVFGNGRSSLRKVDAFANSLNLSARILNEPRPVGLDRLTRIIDLDTNRKTKKRTGDAVSIPDKGAA